MKKKCVLGLLVFLLVFGFFGCENENDNSNNEFTITFDLDGGNINGNISSVNITVNSGETIINLPNTIKTYYSFGGWFSQKKGSGYEFNETTIITSNLTVYANWILYTGPKSVKITGLDTYNGNYGCVALYDNYGFWASGNWENCVLISSGSFISDLWDATAIENFSIRWFGDTHIVNDGNYYIEIIICSEPFMEWNNNTVYYAFSEDRINILQEEITIINFNNYSWKIIEEF